MFLNKIYRLLLVTAEPLNLAKTLTNEEKKFGQILQREGVRGFVHIGFFPLANMSVFFIPEDHFDKVRLLKRHSEVKIVNLQKPAVNAIFEHFKPRDELQFLLLYGDNWEKYKARTILAARVYQLQKENKEKAS